MMRRVAIVGTGLIGASLGLALKDLGEDLVVAGWDSNVAELGSALKSGAIDVALESREAVLVPGAADIFVLAVPVLAILDWMERLSPVCSEQQLVTDVGSTKLQICMRAAELFNGRGQGRFLPGHPMAGKETGGAAQGDGELFRGAAWLFTPLAPAGVQENLWREWVERIGAATRDIGPVEHDDVLAWVSHLPQMLSTALAAELEDRFGSDAASMAAVRAIGGRALRETTRLGASPYSMWRDVALTNTEPLASALQAVEQRLQHMRENLRTPGLREEFGTANRFRAK
jgi:prephenate dehydrogenase